MLKKIYIPLLVFVASLWFYVDFNDVQDYTNNNTSPTYVHQDFLKKKLGDYYNISIQNHEKNTTKHHTKNNTVLLEIEMQKIRALFKKENKKISELDNAMLKFLKNNNISREEKIDALWKLLLEFDVTSNQGAYILDYLETLHPVELVDKAIELYEVQHDVETKMHLVRFLVASLDIVNPDLQSKEALEFIAQKYESVQKLLYNEALDNENEKFVSGLLSAYIEISPPEIAADMLDLFMNDEAKVKLDKTLLSASLSEIAISTDEAQEQILPDLMHKAATGEMAPDAKAYLDTMLMGILNDGGAESMIADAAKENIYQYLQNNEPEIQSQSKTLTDAMADYYTWASAVSKLDTEGSVAMLSKTIEQTQDPFKIASLLLYSSQEELEGIKKTIDTQAVESILETSFESMRDEQERQVVKDALRALSLEI